MAENIVVLLKEHLNENVLGKIANRQNRCHQIEQSDHHTSNVLAVRSR